MVTFPEAKEIVRSWGLGSRRRHRYNTTIKKDCRT
jgi:hypothetical protein